MCVCHHLSNFSKLKKHVLTFISVCRSLIHLYNSKTFHSYLNNFSNNKFYGECFRYLISVSFRKLSGPTINHESPWKRDNSLTVLCCQERKCHPHVKPQPQIGWSVFKVTRLLILPDKVALTMSVSEILKLRTPLTYFTTYFFYDDHLKYCMLID